MVIAVANRNKTRVKRGTKGKRQLAATSRSSRFIGGAQSPRASAVLRPPG
jgi:hypothetical protein